MRPLSVEVQAVERGPFYSGHNKSFSCISYGSYPSPKVSWWIDDRFNIDSHTEVNSISKDCPIKKDGNLSSPCMPHSAPKLEKKCNFKSTKTHYLHFQKWQKINFCTRKKSENCIFGSFKLFSCAKINFLSFLKVQIMLFCTFEIALFF